MAELSTNLYCGWRLAVHIPGYKYVIQSIVGIKATVPSLRKLSSCLSLQHFYDFVRTMGTVLLPLE